MSGDMDRFASASDHRYDCRCSKCLDWWIAMGSDDGNYGPFSQTEINARIEQINAERKYKGPNNDE